MGLAAPDHSDRPLADLLRLDGRAAVVTGAAHGIGAQIVARLAESGADVLAADIDADGAAAAAAQIGAVTGRRTESIELDVGRPDQIVATADAAIAAFGRLDIWVNNAGIFPATGPATEVDVAFLDRMFDINTRGCYLGAREAARRMTAGGVIVNLASTTGFRGGAGLSAYVASKHAVVGITRSLALEFGPLGIRVLGVAPTVIDTVGVRREMEPLRQAGIDVAARAAANPLGRMGVPDDVARVVVFAASDLAAFMTGSILPVDAGQLA